MLAWLTCSEVKVWKASCLRDCSACSMSVSSFLIMFNSDFSISTCAKFRKLLALKTDGKVFLCYRPTTKFELYTSENRLQSTAVLWKNDKISCTQTTANNVADVQNIKPNTSYIQLYKQFKIATCLVLDENS